MSTSTTVHEAEAKTTCLQETKPCCGALHPQLGVLDGVGRRGRGKTHVVDPGDCLGVLFLPPHDRWTKAKLGALSFGSRGQGETLCFLKNCICSGTLGTGAGVSVPRVGPQQPALWGYSGGCWSRAAWQFRAPWPGCKGICSAPADPTCSHKPIWRPAEKSSEAFKAQGYLVSTPGVSVPLREPGILLQKQCLCLRVVYGRGAGWHPAGAVPRGAGAAAPCRVASLQQQQLGASGAAG